jgi:uncharacterized protein DUF4926
VEPGVTHSIDLLAVVALTEDLPEFGVVRGQVGTVVEFLAPEVYEVEFSDRTGEAYAMASVEASQLLVLKHQAVGKPTWP